MAKANLEGGDEVQDSWKGKYEYENSDGYIVLSKKKLLFVADSDILHKNTRLLLQIPYKKIAKIECKDHNKLEFTDVYGIKQYIKTEYSSEVENHIKQAIEQTRPEPMLTITT